MKFKITYPVLKNLCSIILLILFAFQCKAGVMLDTTSIEWNREVDKCVALLNDNIVRNKNIEDSIAADRHFNFNQLHLPSDISDNAKVEEDVTSYMYISDKNNFNFISDASKKNLDGRLRALQFNAGIAFHVMFHPSDYKMTAAEAAYFNSKVYGRSNLGSSSFNKAILILVSVNQIKSVNNFFGYQSVVSTNCNISISTGAGINPEVKNEFTNIINSVFRNAYSESEREQKYNNIFDAVYRKINFSRKVYAYEVDERGNINEELITLPSKMGNNEAATLTLHVRTPFYITGYQSDVKYYKQINPLREEYIKMYSRDFVKLITSSNFPGTYSSQYLYQPPGYAYKDEYQYKWSWAAAIDAAGLVASCVGLDVFTDFVGAVYYTSQGEWVNAGTYSASMFVPFVSGAVIKLLDNTITNLSSKARFILDNTGQYKVVGGHHPLAKKAFEGDIAYDYQEAFSVSTEAVGGQAIHSKITGQQNSLYTAWKKANPNTKLTIDEMAQIEIQAMKNAGIPEDIATGWVVKALEDLKTQGVTEIKNIPWNGTN